MELPQNRDHIHFLDVARLFGLADLCQVPVQTSLAARARERHKNLPIVQALAFAFRMCFCMGAACLMM
jgi:hypothetical protein